MGVLGILGGVVNAATGGLLNAAFGGMNDQRQREQQDYFNREQIKGAKDMGAYNMQQNLAMMKAQYGAQVQGMKDAGLSVSNMYGSGGGGGGATVPTSMPQGGQASGAAATEANAIQLGMLAQQAELTKAQTEKVKAETAAIPTTVQESQSRIDLNKLEAQMQGRSLEDRLSIIQDQERILRTQALVGENTAPQQIEKVQQELTNLAIDQVAKEKGIQLDNAKINEITNAIKQKWEQLNIQKTTSRYEHEDRQQAIKEYTRTTLLAAGINAAGHVISDVVGIATRRPNMPTQKGKSVEKIDKDGYSQYEYTQYH